MSWLLDALIITLPSFVLILTYRAYPTLKARKAVKCTPSKTIESSYPIGLAFDGVDYGLSSYRVDVPLEPPVSSVVIDKNGRAWQRLDDEWAGLSEARHGDYTEKTSWADLLVKKQPLQLVYLGVSKE